MNQIAIDEHGWLSNWCVDDRGVFSITYAPAKLFEPVAVGDQVYLLHDQATCVGMVCGEMDLKNKTDAPPWVVRALKSLCCECFSEATLTIDSRSVATLKFWGTREPYSIMDAEHYALIVAGTMRPCAGSVAGRAVGRS